MTGNVRNLASLPTFQFFDHTGFSALPTTPAQQATTTSADLRMASLRLRARDTLSRPFGVESPDAQDNAFEVLCGCTGTSTHSLRNRPPINYVENGEKRNQYSREYEALSSLGPRALWD